MQAVPESRQQTFEEIYGPPENFLEIEVSRLSLSFFYPIPSSGLPSPHCESSIHVYILYSLYHY